MLCLPNKVNMDQSHRVGKLHHVARSYYQTHQEIFPRNVENPKRAHEADKTRSNTKERKYTGLPTFRGYDNNQSTTKKSLQYLRKGRINKEHYLQQPNGKVTCRLPNRAHVPNDNVRDK